MSRGAEMYPAKTLSPTLFCDSGQEDTVISGEKS